MQSSSKTFYKDRYRQIKEDESWKTAYFNKEIPKNKEEFKESRNDGFRKFKKYEKDSAISVGNLWVQLAGGQVPKTKGKTKKSRKGKAN